MKYQEYYQTGFFPIYVALDISCCLGSSSSGGGLWQCKTVKKQDQKNMEGIWEQWESKGF